MFVFLYNCTEIQKSASFDTVQKYKFTKVCKFKSTIVFLRCCINKQLYF